MEVTVRANNSYNWVDVVIESGNAKIVETLYSNELEQAFDDFIDAAVECRFMDETHTVMFDIIKRHCSDSDIEQIIEKLNEED